MVGRQKSLIWDYFTVCLEANGYAKCNECSVKCSRGFTDPKKMNTSNLRANLSKFHGDLLGKLKKRKNNVALIKALEKKNMRYHLLR